MKTKGIVTGIVRDSKTGKFKRSFTVENEVTDYQREAMIKGFPENSTSGKFGGYIFLSNETGTILTPGTRYVGNVVGVGFTEAGITSPIVVRPPLDTGSPKVKTPPYMQFQQRFNPPAADITITIIGITSNAGNNANVVTYQKADSDAWVELNPTCSQTTTETLDVFYRIQFSYSYDLEDPADQNPSNSDIGFDKTTAHIAAMRYATGGSVPMFFYNNAHMWQGGSFNNNTSSYSYIRETIDYFTRNEANNPFSATYSIDLLKTDMNMDYTISMHVGALIGSFGYGDGGNPTLTHDVRPTISLADGDSPIQGIFGHNANTIKPFFDSANPQSGTGLLSSAGTTWTNPDWPKMYRIDITAGGATGISAYKLKIRNHFGFDVNQYRDQERTMVLMQGGSEARYEGFSIGFPTIAWLDYERLKWHGLAVNPTEICIVNIAKQSGIRTHVSTHPAFTATKIGAVVTDPTADTLWVPCRETGIYKIDNPADPVIANRVVAQITPPIPAGSPSMAVDRCLGIAFTSNGTTPNARMWALWSDAAGDRSANVAVGLYWTDNAGGSWTQDTTWTPETLSNWRSDAFNEIPYIVGDPNHVDMRLCIPYNVSPATDSYMNFYGSWHDSINGSVVGSSAFARYYRLALLVSGNLLIDANDPRSYGKPISASPDGATWGGFVISAFTQRLSHVVYGTVTIAQDSNLGSYGYWVLDTDDNTYGLLCFQTNNRMGIYKLDRSVKSELVIGAGQLFTTRSAITGGGYLYLGEGVFFGSSYAGTQTFASTDYRNAYDAAGTKCIATISTADNPDGYQLFPELNAWTEYGFDGSAWVAGNPNSKLTHTSSDVLVDGVTVTFADSADAIGGAGNWAVTDYYTWGVVDGVWLDGSTEFHHKSTLYFKPTIENNTAIENATLPNVTKSVDIRDIIPALSYAIESTPPTLANNGRDVYMGSYLVDSFAHYLQTNEFHSGLAIGTPSHPNPDNDVHIGMTYNFRFDNSAFKQFIVGFIPSTAVGVIPTDTTTEFGIRIDPPSNGLARYVNVSAVQSGTIMATISDYPQQFSTSTSAVSYGEFFKVEIKKSGHVLYTFLHESLGEVIIYDSSVGSPATPPATAIITGAIHVEFVTSGGSSSGYRDLSIYGSSEPDYYITLGDGSSTGYMNPKLFSIDYETDFNVTIDGIAGINVGNDVSGNDYLGGITPLLIGEYSVFPKKGVIRYSPSDQGKSIAVKYNEISND